LNNETINKLYKLVKNSKAGEGHIISEIYNDKEATCVISIYDGVRPSNIVLDEFYDWAEKQGKTEITEKIEELSKLEGEQND